MTQNKKRWILKRCRKCGSSGHHLLRDCDQIEPIERVFFHLRDTKSVRLNETGCWSIEGSNRNMTIHHPHHGTVYLSRLSYAVMRGMRYEQVLMEVGSKSMVVTTNCGTSRCINPEHLVYMTRQKLVSRSINSGGREKGITDEDKRSIRRKYKSGSCTQAQLAKEYGVKQPSISYIVNHWEDPIDGSHRR